MSTGRQVFRDIESNVDSAAAKQRQAESRLADAKSTLLKLSSDMAGIVGRLAVMRASAIADHTVSAIQPVDRQAAQLIDQREQGRAHSTQWVATETANLAESEKNYGAAQQLVHDLQDQTRALYANVEAALQTDPGFSDLVTRAKSAAEIAAKAADKAKAAEGECKTKLQSYSADVLFAYLLRRNFQTQNYQHTGLVAAMDGWVAGVCGYAAAKHNYDLLQQLPAFLGQHAAEMSGQAGTLQQAIEQKQTAKAGELDAPALAAKLEEAKAALAAVEATHNERRAAMDRAHESVSAYADGTDQYSKQIIDLLSPYIRGESTSSLQADAAKTQSPEDDELVVILDQKRKVVAAQQDVVNQLQAEVDRQRRATTEIRSVAVTYRDLGYNSGSIRFRRDVDVGSAVNGFLLGQLTADAFNSTLRSSAYRVQTQSSSDYSSGGSSGYSGSSWSNNDSGGGFSASSNDTGGGIGSSGSDTGGGI